MRIAVIGGGPGGLYFAALTKELRPGARDHACGSATPPTTPSASASCSPTRPSAASSTPTRSIHAADGRAVRPLGRHRRALPRHGHHRRRPGLRRDEPQGPAADPAASAARELGVDVRLPHRGARRRRRCARVRPGRRRRRGQLRGPHQVRRRLRPDARPCAATSTSGSAPTWSSRPSSSTSARRRTASCRSTATPTRRRAQHLHRRDARRRLAAGRLRRTAGTSSRPGVSDEESIARIRELFGDVLDGHRVLANNSKWLSFTTVAQRAPGGTATSCCSATPRTPRTSPSARARSWPWRTRWRWPPACTSSPTSTPRWPPTRPSGGRWCVHPARGAGQPGVVREHRPVRRPGRRRSSRSTCSPAAAGSPTTTCGCATRSSSAAMDARFAGSRRRTRSRAADVPAVPARRGWS